MSHQLKREYLIAIRKRYLESNRSKKSLILDEFCQVCGYARKYAIAILNGRIEPAGPRPRGRQVRYGLDVVYHLVRLWNAMDRPGSTKFRAAIPEWLEYDGVLQGADDHSLRLKLLTVSRAQVDRLLRNYRLGRQTGLSATRNTLGSRHFRNHIPIQAKDWNVTAPGQQTQGDTVAHCGDSLQGTFAHSLTLTDIFSGWTENRGLWGKTSARVIEAMREMEATLPFRLLGFKSDSGSEFMNHELHAYFRENRPEVPVQFTRSRPYKKDDNCYVEQKNYTHVRQLFGYQRFDDPSLVARMNEIYVQYWCPLQNFFMPTQKLLRKTRVGARMRKEYEKPETPYQRLMNSKDLSDERKQALRERKDLLNPFELQKGLEKKLREFDELLRQQNTGLLLPKAA